MIAREVTMNLRADSQAKFTHKLNDEIIPLLRLQKGFKDEIAMVKADGKKIYAGIKSPFQAMRYHSLAVSRENFPSCLTIVSEADDGEIMGIRHREHPTEGIQFHPESIMTPVGKRLLRNFLKIAEEWKPGC